MSTKIFAPLRKVDIEKQTVVGVVAAEEPDRAGEVMDYESTKPFFEAWSDSVLKLTQGKSRGALREMHAESPVGKVVDIVFDDVGKKIIVTAKIVDAVAWRKVVEGVYTGFSQGGRYVRRWKDEETDLIRFTADPSEISLVDLPCLPNATFEVVKSDGSVEMRKFASTLPAPTEAGLTAEQHRAALRKKADDEVALIAAPVNRLFAEVTRKLEAIVKATPAYIAKVQRCGTLANEEPMPARAATRAVAKDAATVAAEEADRIASMTDEERTIEMLKIALRNPVDLKKK